MREKHGNTALLFAWWHFSLAECSSNMVSLTQLLMPALAALTAGKYSRPAGTPGSLESYVGSE